MIYHYATFLDYEPQEISLMRFMRSSAVQRKYRLYSRVCVKETKRREYMQNKYTSLDRQRVVSWFKEGKRPGWIHTKTGIPRPTITLWRKRAGIKIKHYMTLRKEQRIANTKHT